MRQPAIAFFLSLLAALAAMPLAIVIGRRLNLTVKPRLHGRGRRAVPYVGGAAVCFAVVLALAVSTGFPGKGSLLFLPGLALLVLGLIDDKYKEKGLSPFLRLAAEFALATGAWWVGLRADTPGQLGAFGTVLFLVFVMNAFNLLDNMDGIAGTTAAATALGVTAIAITGGQEVVSALGAAICGASLGFLRYNFKHAKVFLGNSGSLFVGFMVGVAVLKLRPPMDAPWGLVAIPLFVVVPMIDTAVAFTGRFLTRRSFLQGSTDHISHRLFRVGLRTPWPAVVHGALALAGTSVLLAAVLTGTTSLMVYGLGVFAVVGLAILAIPHEPKREAVHWGRAVVAGVGISAVAAAALAIPSALAASSELIKARSDLRSAARLIGAMEFKAANRKIVSAQRHAGRAGVKLKSPFTGPARMVPLARQNLNAALQLAAGAEILADSLLQAQKALQSFPQAEGRPVLLSNGTLDVAPWARARRHLERAAAAARLALARPPSTNALLLPQISRARGQLVAQATAAKQRFETAAATAEVIPPIFGANGPRTYFLMIQNGAEQRGTGGFLGAFGILTADGGALKLERFESNAELPAGPQADPISESFAARYLRFDSTSLWQNTNMTPDFPSAAKTISSMWEKRTGQALDGVIGIDVHGLAALLKLVGPVTTPDWPRAITADNLVSTAVNEAYMHYPDKPERSDFLLTVGREVWTRVAAGRMANPMSHLGDLGRAFSSKRIQVWTVHEQHRLNGLGVDGSLAAAGGKDYLLVVGSNGAANKVDYYARRTISYDVNLTADGTVQAVASVNLANRTPAAGLPSYITGPYNSRPDPPGLNRSYLSLYVPVRSGALSAKVNGRQVGVESEAELGLGVLSRFLEVLPGKSADLEVQMAGHKVTPGRYRLLVQHQPGITADQLDLSIRLPKGAAVRTMTPGMLEKGGRVYWSGALEQDREFEITYGSALSDRAAVFLRTLLQGGKAR